MTTDSSPALSVTDHVSEGEGIALLSGGDYPPLRRTQPSNDNTSSMQRNPKPKVFMYPNEPSEAEATSPYLTDNESKDHVIPPSTARSFDWKFALLLIAVIVAVNVGLIWLFSYEKKNSEMATSEQARTLREAQTTDVKTTPEDGVEGVILGAGNGAAPSQTAPATTLPAADEALAPSAGTAVIPPALPPRIPATKPVNQAEPTAAPAPARTANTPVPSRTVDDQQELLTILNRY